MTLDAEPLLDSSGGTVQNELTPAAVFRNKYYLSQHIHEEPSEQDDDDFVYRPGAIIYAPLNPAVPGAKPSLATSEQRMASDEEDEEDEDEEEDNDLDTISVKSNESDRTILFEPATTSEPKIVLQEEKNAKSSSSSSNSVALLTSSSTLLSKLSKSTAPMRAKLSTLSRSKTNLDHLWASSSATLSLPLMKSTDTTHHSMSLSRKKRKESKTRKNERSQSLSFESSLQTTATSETATATVLATAAALTSDQASNTYPALLSRVAHLFRESIVVSTKAKDSIQYHDVFDGRYAVNILTSIIRTSDRNLAVLVGRALDHQKFFHDVNYECRLRDSAKELYQFQEQQPIAATSKPSIKRMQSADSDTTVLDDDVETGNQIPDDMLHNLPNGVFTLLTDCYSPTCASSSLCYSPLCPRRFIQSQNSLLEENEERLWINTVSRSVSSSLSFKEKRRQENIYELIYTEKDFVEDLAYVEENWIEPLLSSESIPADRREKFVNDLFWNLPEIRANNSKLLNDLLWRQLQHKVVHKIGDIFLKHVSNLFEHFVKYGSHQIISKHILETERSTNPAFAKLIQVIERAPASRKLELNGYLTKPTTRLGRYNLLLKEILKHTPENHPDCETIPKVMQLIKQFLQRVNEESGKTENKFGLQILEQKLTFNKKYPTMQEVDDLDLFSDERKIIMKGPLKKKVTGSNTVFESSQLQVYVLDHCLLLIKSKILGNAEVFKLYKKPIPLALLSIALPDQTRRSSSILPYNRSSTGSFYPTGGSTDFLPSPLLSYSSSSSNASSKNGYPISFIHLGRYGSGVTTLYAPTLASRRKWVDTIEKYRHSVMEKTKVFQMTGITDQYFSTFNKVQCIALYSSFILFGCNHGVYLKKPTPNNKKVYNELLHEGIDDDDDDEGIIKILAVEKVSQIDILETSRLMVILADKNLYTYSLECLFDSNDNLLIENSLISPSVSTSSSCKTKNTREHSLHSISTSSTESRLSSSSSITKRTLATHNMKKIGNNVSFFKIGKVYDKSTADVPTERTLVSYIKYNATTSTIRTMEPCKESADNKKKRKKRKSSKASLGLFIRNSNEALKGFKDLYIPGEATSLQYFKNALCVGSSKGFQMLDIGSAGVQSVLDPNDKLHNFIAQSETLRPISMFKHPDFCFMLCYNEIAFYIDKKGLRIRPDWIIHWEGNPTDFVFRYPYILAFDSSFIEIRNVNTGDLTQIITGHNIRCLQLEPPDNAIYCVMEDRRTGNEMVYSISSMVA